MIVDGSGYAYKRMQVGSTATGDGNSMHPLNVSSGSYALLTAQVVGISGDTITWEGTIDEENWVGLPALNVATRTLSTTTTANGIYRLVVTSLVAVRARISTYGAGTIYVYGLLTAAGEPGFGATPTGGGVTDHALLDNLDFASSGHTGFEAEGTAAAAIATHVGESDPHTQYLKESDYTAADILTKLLTVDGTGSGLDADLLDGNSAAYFEVAGTAAAAIVTHVGLSDPHTQYLKESVFVPPGSTTQVLFNDGGAWGADAGFTYAKATDRLTVAGGLVAPSMRPASDGTSALGWFDASGAQFVYGDTTNQRLGIGATPGAYTLDIFRSGAGVYPLRVRASGSGVFLRMEDSTGFSSFGRYLTATYFESSSGHDIDFLTWGVNALKIKSDGKIGAGNITAPTALLHLAAGTTARAPLRIATGVAPTTPNDGDAWNDGNAYALMVNGTNAVNTDGGLSVWMQSTLYARNVGRLLWQYTDKTDATRASRGSVTAFYTTTEHKPVTWGANSGGALLSFYDVTTPIARQVLATGAGASVDDVITALQALGLVKQS